MRHGFHAMMAEVEACHRLMGSHSEGCPSIIFFSDKNLAPVLLPLNPNGVVMQKSYSLLYVGTLMEITMTYSLRSRCV